MKPDLNKVGAWLVRHGHWVLLGTGLIVVLCTFADYGISWDESSQTIYGELVLDYFQSGLQDKAANSYLNLRYYGPAFDLLSAVVYRGLHLTSMKYEVRHLLAALMGLLAIWGIWRYSRYHELPGAAILAALGLAMMPRFYGHCFINTKDLPFACAFIWGMVGIVAMLKADDWSWKTTVCCGLGLGATLSIRVGGLLLVCFFGAALCFRFLQQWPQRKRWLNWRTFCHLGAVGIIAWAVMVAFWPWAHENPILHPWQAFRESCNFSASIPVLFAGEVWKSDHLPRYYVPWYLIVTTPLPLLALAFAGLIVGCKRVWADWRSDTSFLMALSGLWLFFPITYVLVNRPNVYDGIRHFLFVMPAIAAWAGLGAAAIIRLPACPTRRAVWAFGIVVLLLAPLPSLITLHPYQATYFNSLTGGLAGAGQRYDTEYWTTSYKEAMEWVNDQAAQQPDRPTIVVVAANKINMLCAEHYASPSIQLHRLWTAEDQLPRPLDYYIATTRFKRADNLSDLPIVHVIERKGVAFTVIRSTHGRPSTAP